MSQKPIPRIVCTKKSGVNCVIIFNVSAQTYLNSALSTLSNEFLFMKKLSKGTA